MGFNSGFKGLMFKNKSFTIRRTQLTFVLKLPRDLVVTRPSSGHQSVKAAQKDNSCLI